MFDRPTLASATWLLRVLRLETVGGLLMLAAARRRDRLGELPVGDLLPGAASHYEIGPEALHLHLPLSVWAADFLLAFFFFLAGLELKHEVVARLSRAVARRSCPIVAAVGGMVVPALIYLAITAGHHPWRPPAGAFRWPPTSPSPSRSWRSWAGGCRWPCAPSC